MLCYSLTFQCILIILFINFISTMKREGGILNKAESSKNGEKRKEESQKGEINKKIEIEKITKSEYFDQILEPFLNDNSVKKIFEKKFSEIKKMREDAIKLISKNKMFKILQENFLNIFNSFKEEYKINYENKDGDFKLEKIIQKFKQHLDILKEHKFVEILNAREFCDEKFGRLVLAEEVVKFKIKCEELKKRFKQLGIKFIKNKQKENEIQEEIYKFLEDWENDEEDLKFYLFGEPVELGSDEATEMMNTLTLY